MAVREADLTAVESNMKQLRADICRSRRMQGSIPRLEDFNLTAVSPRTASAHALSRDLSSVAGLYWHRNCMKSHPLTSRNRRSNKHPVSRK